MSRMQLALNVDDIDTAVAFYTALFGVEPAKRRPGYANFVVVEPPLKLVLLENPGQGGTLNHLGVEVGSTDEVHAQIDRLRAAGLVADEELDTTCCYARQDKAWMTGPGGEQWRSTRCWPTARPSPDRDATSPAEESPAHSCASGLPTLTYRRSLLRRRPPC